MLKHRLKIFLRTAWAHLLFHTGLHRLVSRLMPRRLTILAGHCVEHSSNVSLPPDMKISAAKLAGILDWLRRHHDLVSVSEGWQRLQREGRGPSMVALTMDDGYRDNLEVLLPMLAERGITATVYLESRPLDQRRVNWIHHFFWCLERIGPAELVERLRRDSEDETTRARLAEVLAAGGDLHYTLKKVLKYEADQGDVARALGGIFAEQGGDEQELCETLYLSWDEARALRDGGIELGGHTRGHWVLSALDGRTQEEEAAAGRTSLREGLGTELQSFAYPFGRPWDWNEASVEAVRRAGFTTATTTGAGTNVASSDPLRLERLMIGEDTSLPILAAEACGGFALLRHLGLDLSR